MRLSGCGRGVLVNGCRCATSGTGAGGVLKIFGMLGDQSRSKLLEALSDLGND